MTADSNNNFSLERLPSGIAGLDRVMRGGFLTGAVYIIEGEPGAGKTVLANQMCFNHVAKDGRAIFMTLLAESHARMLQHLRPMGFYDDSVMPERLYYVSGFDILESEGLKGIVELLRQEIKRHKANLVVLDGFGITEDSATSERDFKKFVHEIQSHAAASGSTVLLLTSSHNRAVTPEYSIVDGIVRLEDNLYGQRSARELHVSKFRGSGFLRGRHPFRITGDGIIVYPRMEAAYAMPSDRHEYRLERLSTGVHGLDAMIGGGVASETTNGLYGPTGAGKTTLGLQYVALSSRAEPGVFFSFFESPERLRVKAEALGIDLRTLEQRGHLEIIWRPQGEHILDELGHQLIEAVQRRGVKRLFIDGFGGLAESALHRGRLTRYLSVLANQLRAMRTTAIMTIESKQIIGASMRLPSDGMSSLLEGLIIMRYAELEGQIRRVLSITKIRDSDFDPFLHEYKVVSRGIEIGGTFTGVEAMLSGYGQEPKAVPAGQPQQPEE